MTMMKIKIEVKGPKGWAKTATCLHPVYGTDGDWLPMVRVSRTYHTGEIVAAGMYHLPAGSVVGSRRIDTGYVQITGGGDVIELTKAGAMAALGAAPVNN